MVDDLVFGSSHRPAPQPHGGNLSVEDAAVFVFAGNAIFTLENTETGKRYTYKVQQADAQPGDTRTPPWFVRVLTGPDNYTEYSYLGMITAAERAVVRSSAKSRRDLVGGPAHKGLEWLLRQLLAQTALPAKVRLYHEGKCGRCGRKLTVPESIDRGIGPECAGKLI